MGLHDISNPVSDTHVEDTAANDASVTKDEMSLTIWETIRANPKAIAYSLLLSTGPMVYGFDLLIVNLAIAMPSFQIAFGSLIGDSYVIPALWLALWNSMIQVGAMGGALLNGVITDRIGRRFTFSTGGVIAAAGILLVYFADRCESLDSRRSVFLIGKIIVGFALGILNTTSLVFVSEIAPTRVRGPLLSCFTLFIIVGQVTGVGAVFSRISILDMSSYRVCFAAQWCLAGVAALAPLVIPESPVFLIKKNKLNQALEAYKRLYSALNAEANLGALKTVVEHEIAVEKSQGHTSYVQCFKGTDWRRTRIIMHANILQQFVGITMVANATYFLELAGLSPSLVITLTLVQLALGMPCIMISWFTMTILGRRTILLIGSFVIGLLWLGMGIAGCFPNSTSALWFLGIALMLIYFAYALSIGAAYPVLSGETSSIQLRAASQSIGFFVQFVFAWLFSFCVPYMFSSDAGNLGGKVGFIFAFLSAVGFAIVWFEIPETKNRTFAELDEMFEKKLPTRQFKGYVCSGILTTPNKTEEAGV